MENETDTQVKNLTKAIFQHESGQNFDAVGDNGTSHGAGQWQAGTWKAHAKDVLGDENAPMSRDNQIVVAKGTLKHWITPREQGGLGLNAAEAAAKWNSGSAKNWETKEGINNINGKDIAYSVPKYVKNVTDLYHQYKGESSTATPTSQNTGGFNPTPFSKPAGGVSPFTIDTSGKSTTETPTENKDSLGSELNSRLNDVSTAATDTVSGKINPISGILQGVGAVAGAAGDVVNKGLELIPGVKWIEGLIGKGVGALAQTDVGQSVIKSMKGFAEKHPELAKDAESVFNIVTAIPILKGLGVAKNAVLDASSMALKKAAENAAAKDLTATAARTVGGRKALEQGGENSIRTLINERAIPDIAENKYTTQEAFEKLGNKISEIEDKELQPTLAKVSTQNVADRQSIDQLRKEALESVRNEFKGTGDSLSAEREINRKFDGFKNEYGDYVTLQDVNDMKRGVRTSVNFNSPKLESDVSYQLGQVFQKNIETMAEKLGLGDVGAINGKMADLIKAQNMLKHIEGKPVKTGFVGGLIKNTATVGGEMAGNATGIPLAGAFLGREGGGFVGKRLAGVSKGILKRTGKDAERQTLKTAVKKTKGLVKSAVAQKAVNQK